MYQYKELTADNLFDFCDVVSAIGVENLADLFNPDEIKALQSAGKDSHGIGIVIVTKLVGRICSNLRTAREPIYAFLSNAIVSDTGKAVTVKEIRSMNPADFIKLIKDFFTQEGIVDFFKQVAVLLGTDSSNSLTSSTDNTVTPSDT